ncbi:hypothetical protein GALMADRAFT_147351 [Galerina marginata CBS 339.88]|uniref:Uncharacterized protein n=1 Tax=Galerina marginata (strain CBS 339.88) TaxID=685588 RepID=A0A067S8D6_GALM3|nr:hypothetical protein GALMADRAFT_147351 [Galerina marginata CBS 339.88]
MLRKTELDGEGNSGRNNFDDGEANHSDSSMNRRSSSSTARFRHVSIAPSTCEDDCAISLRYYIRPSRRGSFSSKSDSTSLTTLHCYSRPSPRTFRSPSEPSYQDLEDAAPAGYVDDEGVGEDQDDGKARQHPLSILPLLLLALVAPPLATMTSTTTHQFLFDIHDLRVYTPSFDEVRLARAPGVEAQEAEAEEMDSTEDEFGGKTRNSATRTRRTKRGC